MAKRELSSTLRGLKFMQRAAQREDKVKKEEVKPEESSAITRKCVVIMEGDPCPGAVVGRMSFLSFNPSIDKLNEEASNACRPNASGGRTLSSENGSASEAANCSKVGTESTDSGDLKRKQSEMDSEPHKSPKRDHGVQSSPSTSKASKKQSKREKLD
ncbi:hypothetical protein J1N35_008573 [Gossypium stocksii]|uniref:M-phase phosphoprotein 6 n=1 Tax=Gossypium stocksii TaxID=47602 RepID=A0A9D3WBB7_9ROSI|nr:hypothetical protein J1N35_008573 [Gossypium stocksii]